MEKDYYRILGLNKRASAREVKIAYRTLALKYHPDKNETSDAEERFKDIVQAYKILSDTEERKLYDAKNRKTTNVPFSNTFFCSPNGVFFSQNPGHNFSSFSNINFSHQFFNNNQGSSYQSFQSSQPFQGSTSRPTNLFANTKHPMNKTTAQPSAFKQQTQSQGESVPSTPAEPVEHDLLVTLEELMSGCTRKIFVTCRLVERNSNKIMRIEKEINIEVKPGWRAGTRIAFPEEGDQLSVDVAPQDIVFIVKEKPHAVFQRDKANLLYVAKVTLKECLCGTTIQVPTLSGKTVPLKITDVIQPGSVRKMPGFGLPHNDNRSTNGDIVVSFNIQFPDTIDKKRMTALKNVLP